MEIIGRQSIERSMLPEKLKITLVFFCNKYSEANLHKKLQHPNAKGPLQSFEVGS